MKHIGIFLALFVKNIIGDYMKKVFYSRIFARRSAACFFMLSLLFLFTIMRITVLASKDYSNMIKNQNFKNLYVTSLRGTIYDCNNTPITNNQKKIYAVVFPCEESIEKVGEILKGKEKENTLNQLKKGESVLLELQEKIDCKGFYCQSIYTTNNKNAIHTIGYTDSQNKAVIGIEKAYDDILNLNYKAEFIFEADAKGHPLKEATPKFLNNIDYLGTGVVTTLDLKIQKIVEEYSKNIEKGAIIVADSKTSKIRAIVSFPTFDLQDSKTLENLENSPFLNRAINTYNIGSVFKPCIAAAAAQNSKDDFLYVCKGKCKIEDRYFKCHEAKGHALTDLRHGLANSCNTYFYNLAFTVGNDDIYTMIKNLKFGSNLKLCENIYTKEGNIPEKATLENRANLANLSIGQGELLLSPVALLNLYSSIASDGLYYTPSLVEGTLKNGNFTEYDIGFPTRAMKEKSAQILREDLKEIFISGTAKDFRPNKTTAAGKTATAQTGKFKNSKEICSSWFCGFFPYENPKYTVIVFSQDSLLQNKSCAQIFSEIADKITEGGF